jgi:hypothetical protein
MKRLMRVTAAVLCFSLTGYWGPANSQQPNAPEVLRPAICDQFTVDGRASTPLRAVTLPPLQTCTTHTSNGFPVPDPNCTPGAINPTLTIEVLRDRRFTTRCIRDSATQEEEKATTYQWYNLAHPGNYSGESQICELDHLVSLELGGADTLDNIWPQCGPSGVALPQRFFKEKDTVENFLAMQVREGRMDLGEAQKGIATDWTQFLDEARRACPEGRCF